MGHQSDRKPGEDGKHYRREGWMLWPFIFVPGVIGLSGLIAALSMPGWREKVALFVVSVPLVVMAVAGFRWNRRRGVWADADGVRNIGAGRPSFTPWSNIERFSIDRWGAAFAVYLERKDGSREALQNEINLSFRRRGTERFAAVMNADLASRRSS